MNPLVHRIGWTLIHSTWEGVVVAGILAAVLWLLRRGSAQARYLACCAAMAMIVTAVVLTFASVRPTRAAGIASPPMFDAAVGHAIELANLEASVGPMGVLDAIVLVWAAGVAVMGAWHVGGWLWLCRLRRGTRTSHWDDLVDGLKRRLRLTRQIALVETRAIDVPAVVGVFRPVIFVPLGIFSGLAPQQVEAILAHELAHVRRHDYLMNLGQTVVETILFYHPAVWWICACMRCERENCCDDIAAGACGDAKGYAAALTELEARRGSAKVSLAAGATGGNLRDRVRRLLRLPPATRPQRRFRSLAAVCAALVVIAAPPMCVRAQQQRQHKPQTQTSPPPSPPVQSAATTKPVEEQYRYVKVIVGKSALIEEGKPVTIEDLTAQLSSLPEARRKRTVLAVAAGAPDVTVERFFSATAELRQLVSQFGLAYLSEVGIHPTTEPASNKAAAAIGSLDPELSMLQRQKTLIEIQIDALAEKLGPEHPSMRRAREMLDHTRKRIEDRSLQMKQAAAEASVEQIAQSDATMREYLKTRDAMAFNLARLARSVGSQNRTYLDATADLQMQNRRIDDYAQQWRSRMAATQP